MTDVKDKVTIAFGGGDELDVVTSLTLSDTFLDPCQTMTATLAADETRFNVVSAAAPGSAFTVFVNGHPQCTGIVDCRDIESSQPGGRLVSLTGRDLLSQMVDGNADPRIAMAANMPFDEFCQKAFAHFGMDDVTIFEEYGDLRNLVLGKAVKTKKQAAKRRRKFKDPIDGLRPKDNEGGFQWFVRIAHRLGYHAWAVPGQRGVVVGTPDYDQDPAYELVSLRSQGTQGLGAGNNIKWSRARTDITGLPSHVYVRGKSSKKGEAKSYIGTAKNPKTPIFKPFFVADDDSSSQAHCDAYARLILSRAMRNAQTYECKARSLTDPQTGRVFNVDTVATVKDESAGVDGKMWVESRTFNWSRETQETSLKLLPSDALVMDYYVSDSVPPLEEYDAAKTKIPNPKDTTDLWNSALFAQVWAVDNAGARAQRGRLWVRGRQTSKTSSQPCSARTRRAARRRSLRSPCAPPARKTDRMPTTPRSGAWAARSTAPRLPTTTASARRSLRRWARARSRSPRVTAARASASVR